MSDTLSQNPAVEQRYQSALTMKSIARQKDMSLLPTDPAFLSKTIGSYLPTAKYSRTNEDIKEAVKLWCTDRVAAEAQYGHISQWETSGVTNMRSLFGDCKKFNDDIRGWNVSNVTNMAFMFNGAKAFNHDIGGWNVSKVTNMERMFASATAFNHDIARWDVSNVTNMSGMFVGATSFNRDIGRWNVSNVTDMGQMFAEAESFNQNIGEWNVSKVKIMSGMFYGATSFNQDISRWKISKKTKVNDMFNSCPIVDEYKPVFPSSCIPGSLNCSIMGGKKTRKHSKRPRKSMRRARK